MRQVRLQKIIPATLLGLTGVVFGFVCWQLRYDFLVQYDPKIYEAFYTLSQFGYGAEVMQDSELYAYAGYEYLTTGDLTQINIEHPPLGKYLIGLSILIFGNQNVVNIGYGLCLLYLSWRLAGLFFEKIFAKYIARLLAPLVPLLLIFEGTFWSNMTSSLLDMPQAVLLLLFFLLASDGVLLQKKLRAKKELVLGGLIGLLACVKYPAMAVMVVLSYLTYHYFFERVKGKIYLVRVVKIIAVSVVVFTLNYGPLIFSKGLGVFVTTIVTATRIHLSHVPNYPPGALLRVLFLNQWPRWFEPWGYQTAPYWNWTWPLLGSAYLLSPLLFLAFFKKKSEHWVVFIFSWLYFGFLASRLYFPNYFFALMPLGFIFMIGLFGLIFTYLAKRVRPGLST